MKKTKHTVTAFWSCDNRKEADEMARHLKDRYGMSAHVDSYEYNEVTKHDTIHLVKDGDSMFGLNSVACGIKCTDGMVGHFDPSMVTCGACKRTKLFKEMSGDYNGKSGWLESKKV